MDPFNVNELATTIISQAHEIRRLQGQVASLEAEAETLRSMLPQDDPQPEPSRPSTDDASEVEGAPA
jgi:hypothetical protein